MPGAKPASPSNRPRRPVAAAWPKFAAETTVRTLVLWDIDHTLLYTGGAGSLAMARAFRDLYGVDDAFRHIEFSGRTDAAIFRNAARACGIPDADAPSELSRFADLYVPHLHAALEEVSGGRLMPGIRAVLESLAARGDVAMALGTGNLRRGGEAKLRHFGIATFFPGVPGGFGDDSPDREEVIRIAIRRASAGRRPPRIVVVGDTPHDVAAARANGALAVAVATGRSSVDELRACGADEALDDLSDLARSLRIICGS
jgi:phosphoglycolate phosphatase